MQDGRHTASLASSVQSYSLITPRAESELLEMVSKIVSTPRRLQRTILITIGLQMNWSASMEKKKKKVALRKKGGVAGAMTTPLSPLWRDDRCRFRIEYALTR